jgi:hypothetical protein
MNSFSFPHPTPEPLKDPRGLSYSNKLMQTIDCAFPACLVSPHQNDGGISNSFRWPTISTTSGGPCLRLSPLGLVHLPVTASRGGAAYVLLGLRLGQMNTLMFSKFEV